MSRTFGLEIGLKQTGLSLRIHADAGVFHLDPNANQGRIPTGEDNSYPNQAALSELDGIGDQIGDHLSQSVGISLHPFGKERIQLNVQSQFLLGGPGSEKLSHALEHLAKVEFVDRQPHLAGLDLRVIEAVIENIEQRAGTGTEGLRPIALLGIERTLLQQMDHPQHAVERGADLMAQLGQKQAFGPFRFLGATQFLGQFLGPLQHLILDRLADTNEIRRTLIHLLSGR